jgi:hypothetical protein
MAVCVCERARCRAINAVSNDSIASLCLRRASVRVFVCLERARATCAGWMSPSSATESLVFLAKWGRTYFLQTRRWCNFQRLRQLKVFRPKTVCIHLRRCSFPCRLEITTLQNLRKLKFSVLIWKMRFCRGDDHFVHLLRMGNLATITVWGCSSVFAQKVFNILLFKTIHGGCKKYRICSIYNDLSFRWPCA